MTTIAQAPFEGQHVRIEFAMHKEANGVDALYFRAADGSALRLGGWPTFECSDNLPAVLEEMRYDALKRNLRGLGVAAATVEVIADALFPDDYCN